MSKELGDSDPEDVEQKQINIRHERSNYVMGALFEKAEKIIERPSIEPDFA